MKLKGIALGSEYKPIEIDKNYYIFDFNEEYIIDWISRSLRGLNIECNNFNRINIQLRDILEPKHNLSEKYLTLKYPFTQIQMTEFSQVSNYNARMENYIQLYERALQYLGQYYDIHLPELLDLLNKFRLNNYKNEFVKMKKQIREFGIYIDIVCKYDAFSYKLFMEVYDIKHINLITKGLFYEIMPNVFTIAYFCPRKLVVDGNKLYTLRSTPKDTRDFEFDLKKLAKGEFNYKELVKVNRNSDKIAILKSWLKE